MDPLVVIIQGQQFKLKNLNNLVASSTQGGSTIDMQVS